MQSAQASSSEKLAPGVWKVVLVVLLGPFMTSLDSTVVNVSMSTLASELHSTIGDTQWIISGYLLALALMLPLSGWLVDRVGAKRIYIGCFTAFTIASVLCGVAQNMGQLIFFRVLQGMAGGLLAPMAQMMIARIAGRQLARVMGYSVMPILLAPILGPVIAGAVLQSLNWRWLFYLNLPIGVLALALAVVLLPSDEENIFQRPFDLPGFLLLSPGLALLLYGLENTAHQYGRCCLVGSVPLLAAFLLYAKRKGKTALIDIALFREPVFLTASITQFFSNGVTFAGQMLTPLFLISGCHLSAAQTGLLVAPTGLGMMVSYPLMGFLTEKFGCRAVSAGGALLALLATLPFIWMAQYEMIPSVLAVTLFFRGMGLGAINIPSMSAAYASVTKEKLAIATTAINIVQRLGGPIATTLAALILESSGGMSSSTTTSHSFVVAFIFLSALQVVDMISACFLPVRVQYRSGDQGESKLQAMEALTD